MVERYKWKKSRKGESQAGHFKKVDGRRHNGRPKGATNKLSRSVQEALIATAMLLGENNRGKEGMIGFFKKVFRENPIVGAQLLGQVMGHQERRKDPPPTFINGFQLPPERLSKFADDELDRFRTYLERATGEKQEPELLTGPPGDAEMFAKEVGMSTVDD